MLDKTHPLPQVVLTSSPGIDIFPEHYDSRSRRINAKDNNMDSRYYPGVEADVSKLVAELRNIFDQDYEVQTMHVSATTIVQARKSSTLRDLTGLSAALTTKI